MTVYNKHTMYPTPHDSWIDNCIPALLHSIVYRTTPLHRRRDPVCKRDRPRCYVKTKTPKTLAKQAATKVRESKVIVPDVVPPPEEDEVGELLGAEYDLVSCPCATADAGMVGVGLADAAAVAGLELALVPPAPEFVAETAASVDGEGRPAPPT